VTLSGVPVPVRLLVAARSLIAYLWMMIWPAKLFPYYPHPLQVSLLSWQYASAAALVIATTIASVALIRRQSLFAALWGYYVVTLIPVLGLVQVGVQGDGGPVYVSAQPGPFSPGRVGGCAGPGQN